MPKTNRFHVKEIDKQNVTVEEERKYRSPFILFLIRNGKLILTISLLFSLSVFIIAFSLIMKNIKDSSILTYESNGVIVKFTSSDESILDGTPITPEYADKLFTNSVQNSNNEGVVIKINEETFNYGKVIFYSDKTILIKYNDGTYLRVYPVNNNYAVDKEGVLNSVAVRKSLTGEIKQNALGMNILYLSDGSTEVTYQDETIFVRNGDMTSTNDEFYTNLSLVSIKKKEENGKIYYSKNIIKENNTEYLPVWLTIFTIGYARTIDATIFTISNNMLFVINTGVFMPHPQFVSLSILSLNPFTFGLSISL